MFRQIGLAGSVPRCTELSFANWWRKIIRTEKKHRKGLNSLIILGAWIIWKHSVDAELDHTPARARSPGSLRTEETQRVTDTLSR